MGVPSPPRRFTAAIGDTDALKELAEASGKATGLPVEQGFNFAEGAAALAEGETRTGTLLILGWPPSVAAEE